MKKTENFIDKLIIFCIMFFPILDLITSVMIYNNFDFSIGIILKSIILVFVYVYSLLSKNISKFNKIFLILFAIFCMGNLANNFNYIYPNFNIKYITLVAKFVYFIVFAIFFSDYLKTKKYNISVLKTPIKIILISMLIALITGTSLPSYDNIYKVGVGGWFSSANEIGGLLTLLFPISIYIFFHDEKSRKIEWLYVIIHAMSLLLLGTKVGLIGFFAVTIVYLVYRIIFIKKYSYKNGFLLVLGMVAASCLLWNFLPCVKNTSQRYDVISSNYSDINLTEEQIKEKKDEVFDELVYSGRNDFLEKLKETKEKVDKDNKEQNISNKRNYKKIANDYLGYLYMDNDYLLLTERDFYDILLFFGRLGLVFLLLTFIIPIFRNIKNLFKHLFELKIIMVLLSITLALGVAYISGHTIISPMVSFYLAIVLGLTTCEVNNNVKNNKKKLLIGSVHMKIGGIETSLINLLNNIDYEKYQVDLFLLLKNGENLERINKKVNIITPYNFMLSKVINSESLIGKIIKHLLYNRITAWLYVYNKKYDVAIDYSGYYLFIDNYILNSYATKKLIWIHTDLKRHYEINDNYRKKYSIHKKKYKYFDKIICVSDGAKNQFINMLSEYKSKCTVMYNLVNLNKSGKSNIKLEGNFKIVSVGRLTNEKNYNLLIEVHKKLIENGYDVNTYIIGDGYKYDELNSLIKKYKINKTCKLLGAKTNVRDYLLQSDLFVSTSLYEAFGIVLLEALECKVPFVAPNILGIKDIHTKLAPANSSILVPNTVDGFYNGIIDAMSGKVTKDFNFDLVAYNERNIKTFEKIISN